MLFLLLSAASVPVAARKVKQVDRRAEKPVPEVEKKVIAVQTAHTGLVLIVHKNGVVTMAHYGKKVLSPDEFMEFNSHQGSAYGNREMAFPTQGGSFLGTPALSAVYADGSRNTELYYVSHDSSAGNGVVTTTVRLKDYVTSLEVALVYEAYQDEDVIVAHSEITNPSKTPVILYDYASSSVVIPVKKALLTHFWGSWASEMNVDRTVLTHGIKTLESFRGTMATQNTNPSFLLSLGTDRFDENAGEVIAGALQWSGNFRISFNMDNSGRLGIVSGINSRSSEYKLLPGASFQTPGMVWTYSAEGAGKASRNLHDWARNWCIYGGGKINPTLLNSWEGAYFTFTTETLLRMIDDAAGMGLEMFVLDDGWFGSDFPRDNDKQGLGDWELNSAKIPEGIDFVARYAHSKGIKFGIWIEPEMVNPRSNLAAAHPGWVVRSPERSVPTQRNQWLLDLTNPDVQDFVFGVFDRTMQLSSNIDYIKWDCNRYVAGMGSEYLGEEQNRFYLEYVQGLYSVMRRVREKYPDTIVQCCSSGGSRVDYGALRYFNEVWTSDDTDALARAFIQYGTNMIYPACVTGSHVSAVPNHQTANVTPIKMRFDMACSGRLGMELQPKNLTPQEREFASAAIASYEKYRDIVFGGDLYRLSSPYDDPLYSFMYVSKDKSRAVVFSFNLKYTNRDIGGVVMRLRGLDSGKKYTVTELNVDKSCWWGSGKAFSGDFLMEGGFNPRMFKLYESSVFYLEAK